MIVAVARDVEFLARREGFVGRRGKATGDELGVTVQTRRHAMHRADERAAPAADHAHAQQLFHPQGFRYMGFITKNTVDAEKREME
jgi:hypothetical protein